MMQVKCDGAPSLAAMRDGKMGALFDVDRGSGFLRWMLLLFIVMAIAILSAPAMASAKSTAALVQVEIAVSEPEAVKIFSLKDPKRVVLDIGGKVQGVNAADVSPLISDIRMARKPYGTRVVFDLAQPATLIEAKYNHDGSALVVWLVPSANSIFDAQRNAPFILEPNGKALNLAAKSFAIGGNKNMELHPVGNASAILKQLFGIRPTSSYRAPDHPLSLANPNSYHTRTRAAVDVRPIPGMSFEDFVDRFRKEGFGIIEAINEVGAGRSAHATGDHWHIVLGEWR